MMEYRYKSKNHPGVPHIVTVEEDGTSRCSCESFLYSRTTPASCKHTDDVRAGGTGDFISVTDPLGLSPISPMLASKPPAGKGVDDFSAADWALEEKYDGHRLIVTTQAGGEPPLAWSRVGNLRVLPPHIVTALLQEMPTGTFDGELYLPGGTSTDVTALENLHRLRLVFFDVLRIENAVIMNQIGTFRRLALETVGAKLRLGDFPLHIAEQWDPSQARLLELWNRGGEGGILKRRDAIYAPGKRSKDWLKLKKGGSALFTLIGFLPGSLGPHAVMCLRDDDGVDITTKTLNDSWRAEFATKADSYIGRRVWVDYQERTRDGKYRHPMVDRFEEAEDRKISLDAM